MDLQDIAEKARTYCEEDQNREFELDGACHENAIGAGDYLRLRTEYNPIIVWGEVSHKPESESPNDIENVSELTTHFWLELEGVDGIIDVYTNNPLVGDITQYIESGIAHGGDKPSCYNEVQKFRYYGSLSPYDLAHKDNFIFARDLKPVELLS